jgi:hypothetical protein
MSVTKLEERYHYGPETHINILLEDRLGFMSHTTGFYQVAHAIQLRTERKTRKMKVAHRPSGRLGTKILPILCGKILVIQLFTPNVVLRGVIWSGWIGAARGLPQGRLEQRGE